MTDATTTGTLISFADLPDPTPDWGPWGPWRFTKRTLTLEHTNGYWVDLARCTTSGAVLDWIMQITRKSWADDACVAQLVRAFHALLDPQANLCSGGTQTTMQTRRVLRQRLAL